MIHLKNGDPEPTINPDKFTLYDMQFCPFCQRVRYTLDYHQIPYDRVMINLTNKPDWYLKLYPKGKVPLLSFKNEKLVESDLVMKFVDQFKGTESSLLSVCGEAAFKKALEFSLLVANPMVTILYSKNATQKDVDEFKAACKSLNDFIVGPYLYGEKMSLADLAVFPFLNDLEHVLCRAHEIEQKTASATGDAAISAAEWPKLTAYRHVMEEKPFVKATGHSETEYEKFFRIHVTKDLSESY